MFKIDPTKNKKISFDISVQGIDHNNLEYNLRLFNESQDYGIRGEYKNGTVTFLFPKLNNVLSESQLKEFKSIKFEVNDKNNKYYLKPYQDLIKIEIPMKVEASIKENIDEETKINLNVTEIHESEEIVSDTMIQKDSVVDKKEKKEKSKIGKFLEV